MSYNWSIETAALSTAAGHNKTWTVTAKQVWEPMSVSFTVACSTVSATRIMALQLVGNDTASTVCWTYITQTSQTASSTASYNLLLGVSESTAARNTSVWQGSLPSFQAHSGQGIKLLDLGANSTADSITGTITYMMRSA